MGDVRLERVGEGHLSGLAKASRRQEKWWKLADDRLREGAGIGWSRYEWGKFAQDPEVFAVAALDGEEVLGGAAVWVRELEPDSTALAMMGPRDGMFKALVLPSPDDARYGEVVRALFGEVERWWDGKEATGANLVRPLCEGRLAGLMEERGWGSNFVIALRPAGPLTPSARVADAGLRVRFAEAEDVEAVVALHLEEYEYHVGLASGMRMVPAQEAEIRDLLAESFRLGDDAEEMDRKRMFVVECEGEVVATSIAFLYEVKEDTPGLYALGRYCHIGSTGVRGDMRGKGVGRALVEGITRFYEPMGVRAYSLWYHDGNPLSSVFWPRLGWVGVARRWRRG